MSKCTTVDLIGNIIFTQGRDYYRALTCSPPQKIKIYINNVEGGDLSPPLCVSLGPSKDLVMAVSQQARGNSIHRICPKPSQGANCWPWTGFMCLPHSTPLHSAPPFTLMCIIYGAPGKSNRTNEIYKAEF